MRHKQVTSRWAGELALVLTLALFFISSLVPNKSLWGINHFQFLDGGYKLLLLAAIAMTLLIFRVASLDSVFGDGFSKIHNWFWSERRLPRILFAAAMTLLFYLFRSRVHLLGDGYAWLGILGHGPSYIHKWTEPGSIYLIRLIQNLLGAYSKETALFAFQIVSVISGGIYVYTMISLIGKLCATPMSRVLGLSTFIFSGSLLLFFGYVEFYPITWAASVLLINLTIRYLTENRGLWLMVASCVFAILMHLQTLLFLPGLVYVLTRAAKPPFYKKVAYFIWGLGIIAGTTWLVRLYHTRIDFEVLILPLFKGRPVAPDYSVFSTVHLLDLGNLIFLIYPGIVIISGLFVFRQNRIARTPIAFFLGICAVCSLLFLSLYGAAITMGRDWDVMSLGLLAPMLFLMYRIGRSTVHISVRLAAAYSMSIAIITFSFLFVSLQPGSSEQRFATLLNTRNEGGWAVYANYFLEKGDIDKYKSIMQERRRRFPHLARLQLVYTLLDSADYQEAMKIAQELVRQDPYDPDFLQVLGNLYGKANRLDSAEELYCRALRLRPYSSTLMNEFAKLYLKEQEYEKALPLLQVAHKLTPKYTFIIESLALTYIHLKKLSSAEALADTLFCADKNSPGGHLIKMTIALDEHDRALAKYHYSEYLKYGKERTDYQRIKDYYKNLDN
jgi:tetratricopeptide (TPR) repeat protein